ncbi:MAG: response regulator transcription factor [Acidobacteriia bacterium]|nr:response regulator transcription factor [Terriglobia bacterium]
MPGILLADDHIIVRQGLRSLLERHGFEVVAEASDGREAVTLAEELRPEIAILDLSMPILNGIEATREILKLGYGIRVVLLTMHSESADVLAALSAGVSAYVLKSRAAEHLVTAIEEVRQGNSYLSPQVSRSLVDALLVHTAPPAEPLSTRERQILQLIAEGMRTKEVAEFLSISVKTAESHRTKIMHKLGIHDTASLVRYALRHGLIEP